MKKSFLLSTILISALLLKLDAQNCNGLNCNDGNPCTLDFCLRGECFNSQLSCNDNNACTIDQCAGGSCVHSESFCNDGIACTLDNCDSLTGCAFTPIICDDEILCTNDSCINGICVFPVISGCNPCAGIVCDDVDLCTIDSCINGSCFHFPVDCDDGVFCTFDYCVSGVCTYSIICCGQNSDCDDNDLCTIDTCFGGICENTSVLCDDGDICTIDTCNAGNCMYIPNPGCADPCLALNCDDGDFCTIDTCINGTCLSYPVDCDDGNFCTADDCSFGLCTNTPVASCCTTATQCSDNNACTIDACDNGVCFNTPVSSCCTTATQCNDNNACTTDACNSNLCVNTPIANCCTSASCNDNDSCTNDLCISGVCYNLIKSCSDNNACTIDQCQSGNCLVSSAYCSDGNACTSDNCNPLNGCVFNSMVCYDGDACTKDSCLNGNCSYIIISGCSDSCIGITCTDADLCTYDSCIQGVCEYYSITCDDGEQCTQDDCFDGECWYTPNCEDTCYDEDPCTIDYLFNAVCYNLPINCNDNDACTIDQCMYGACLYSASFCNDEDACTANGCDSVLGCITSPLCDDGDACTSDNCLNGNCTHTLINCAKVSGAIISEQGSAISSVALSVTGQSNQAVITGINGLYEFDLPQGGSYTLTPSKANDSVTNNGITTLDILHIRRHILHMDSLNSPYKIIAADANESASVTTSDILLIRAVILIINPTFPNGKLWAFVPDDYVFANPMNPFPYSQFRSYNNLNSNQTGADFVGIKLGDVNNSWNPSVHKTEVVGKVQFIVDEHYAMRGDKIIVPVKVRDFENISGYQFSVSWNAEVLSLSEVNTQLINGHYGKHHINDGILITSWDEENGGSLTLDDDAVAFNLEFDALGRAGSISEVIIGSKGIQAEAYTDRLDLLEIASRRGIVKMQDAGLNDDHQSSTQVRLSVQPNPFNNFTNIVFMLQKDDFVNIAVYDLLGNAVTQFEEKYNMGEHKLQWNGEDKNGIELSNGLYHVRLLTGSYSIGVKVILIK